MLNEKLFTNAMTVGLYVSNNLPTNPLELSFYMLQIFAFSWPITVENVTSVGVVANTLEKPQAWCTGSTNTGSTRASNPVSFGLRPI